MRRLTGAARQLRAKVQDAVAAAWQVTPDHVGLAAGWAFDTNDTARRMPFMLRPGNFNTLAGNGTSPLFNLVPYAIDGQEPKVKWTVKNLETVATNNIQFGMYGFQVKSSKDHR